MAESWQRRAWAEVDLDAVSSNARVLRAVAAPAELCAVVKADAYGHGAVPVASAALAGGATSLAVALVEEGVVLREAGLEVPILLLSEPAAAAMGEVVARDLIPTVYTRAGVNAIRAAAARASRRVEVEVKLDSGMHRVGADPEEARRIVEQVVQAPELRYGGLWTHLAIADEPSDPFTAEQLARFEAFRGEPSVSRAPLAGPRSRRQLGGGDRTPVVPLRPRALRDLSLRLPALQSRLPRAHRSSRRRGVAPGTDMEDPGQPCARAWRGRVHELRPGIRAGGAGGHSDGARRLCRRGSAEPFPRRGELLIGGRRRRVAGTVTMDQLMVDCGPDSGVRCGDEVVLIGSQGAETVSAQEWADRIGTISFEILCRIGPRLPRRHVRGAAAGPL